MDQLQRIKTFIKGFSNRQQPSRQPQLLHYERQWSGERSRIHLRLDADGSGLLMVNASRVMHLNPTAARMARLVLDQVPFEKAILQLQRTYHAPQAQIEKDYTQFTGQIEELIRPNGACPIHELDIETTAPFSVKPSTPYRMDLAITYRCNNDCAHCYNDRPRNYPEMDTVQWKKVLDTLWKLGIPHVVFTGGEPTLRADLIELVAHAEKNGQITGLNTNARRLHNAHYVAQLVDAGLDHVQITVESHLPEVHDQMVRAKGAWEQTITGLQNALDSPLYVMTNTTMLTANSPSLAETLDFLGEIGVPTVGLNALIYSGKGATVGAGLAEEALIPLLDVARQKTDQHNQRLIWYTPTEYCHFDPMQLDLGVKGCTAALYNMCIEPDGSVIPCQSYYQSLGNILTNPWDSLWNHPLSVHLRERHYVAEDCKDCSLLSECGGGCPLKPSQPRSHFPNRPI